MRVDDAIDVKTCPQCGQLLFADMSTCYGCLHSFVREGGPVVGQAFASAAEDSPVGHAPARHFQRVEQSRTDVGKPGGTVCPSESAASSTASLPDPWVRHRDDAALATKESRARDDAEAARVDEGTMSPSGSSSQVVIAPAEASAPSLRPPELTMELPALREAEPKAPPTLALRVQSEAMDVVLPLPAGGLNVGRAPDNDIVLHSRAVSRRHMRIEPANGGATIFDLGATNPALVRGHEVPAELALMSGDVVDVCGTLMSLVGTS